MKVLLINGSPRKNGNTSIALAETAKRLEADGIDTETVWIGAKAVQGCIACGKCGELGHCAFNDKLLNDITESLRTANGLIVGSPVYYGGPNGSLCALMDRMFYSALPLLQGKPAAAVVVCRRGGATAAFNRLNMYYMMSNMPVVTSQYWNIVYGQKPGEGAQDAEGLQTMRTLADNMAWMLKSIHEGRLPMSEGMPDVLFADEEVGVVALKNGEEMLYASLYWRANFAVNFLARVHYITPRYDRVATVFEDVQYTPSGYTYVRPERNNLFFSPARNFYPEVKSAHTGERLPIARIPDGVAFKPGDESVYAGKGDFYTLRYGKYLIAMNCTKDRVFEVEVPRGGVARTFPGKDVVKERKLEVQPRSTVVVVIE